MNPLQEVLEREQLTRDVSNLIALFNEGGIDFYRTLAERVADHTREEHFSILEIGCGSGSALEQAVRDMRLKNQGKKIQGIGIDLNPLPGMIPGRILTIPEQYPSGLSLLDRMFFQCPTNQPLPKPISYFARADASALPIADNRIDFGYSVSTLVYVADTLKTLEEGYRVLKEGGIFLLEICSKEISGYPFFDEILEKTPGASKVFTYVPSKTYPNTGFLICRKSKDDGFKGFPYVVVMELRPEGAKPGTREYFHRNAFYRSTTATAPDENLEACIRYAKEKMMIVPIKEVKS